MKLKAGFSPWKTKNNSFEEDQECIVYQASSKSNLPNMDKVQKISQAKKSSRKKQTKDMAGNPILRSFSKTQTFVTPVKDEENSALGWERRVTKSSQKIYCNLREQRSGKKFDDERWKILTISSNDRFKSECAQLRKYQNFASELKSRRSSLRSSVPTASQTTCPSQREKPILQQISIKNFIIHGHYTDKESFYQLSKRRDASYVMKQKFATLKKTIDTKENNEPRRVVVVKGNNKEKEKQNLFKVIKLEREINSNTKRIL